jgi:hypothetical protein
MQRLKKILIANRGDQPQGGAATKSNRLACAARAGDLAAEANG